ncbi:Glycoside hydrolase [Rhizoctonia solani]|uniref:lytic cellulose monooxygenase (C4-dehydrogenating) n=1 Tax=Rhizoctonia solani TaxID=456999 RepID=A0A8H7HD66_9AGAM|nr:Glycoside hydrolase [Rhizoctonia solani]
MRSVISLLFATATTVLGHGYVQEVVTSSGTYTGYLPYSDPYTSPAPERVIRKIPGNGPVEDLTSIDIQCNGWSSGGVAGSVPAAKMAVAAAGTQVALNWTTWPDSHVGPVITYMARAPSDITKWNPGKEAVWFKVAQQGYENGKWAATDILTGENNSIARFTIPASLKAGQYLIRHEIIALHSAYAYPGAQFYPSCIQVEVTGSGTETGPSELVAFPGAYTETTPGIVFDAYKGAAYPIPGPAVWTGGAGSPASNAPVAATSAASTPVQNTSVGTPTTAAAGTSKAPSSTAAAPSSTSPASLPSSASTSGAVAQYGQCGGTGYTGPTACVSPFTCKKNNDYYSQSRETEFITPYLVHPSQPANPWPEQLLVDKKSPDGQPKKTAAKIISNEIEIAEANPNGNIVHSFSDGHAGILRGVPKVALGYIVKYGRKILADESRSIGPRANIYDAEMLGIAMCLGRSVQIAEQHAHSFLSKKANRHITVKWLPGHSKITGNERADEAAKRSEELRPTPIFNRTITWSRANATKRATSTWRKTWDEHVAARPDSGTFIPSNPSLKLHPIFNHSKFPRNVQCRLVQFLTGHGFYGEYSARFHPHVDPQCSCGEPKQTPEHLLMFCPDTEEHRHIITSVSPDRSWEEIFGTLPGLEAVSEFILKSGIGKCGDPPATAQPL